MARPPINPAAIDWSGENPGMYLKESADGDWTCLVSFFRVVASPHGPGHAAVVMLDPSAASGAGASANACYTDNEPLARYLLDEFVSHFGPFKGNPNLASLPMVQAERFTHEGSHTSSWTERIQGPGLDVTLTWGQFDPPFFVEYLPPQSATGQHEMFSLFVPGHSATVDVNGRKGRGKPVPRDQAGRQSTTAFLAFSETWLRP